MNRANLVSGYHLLAAPGIDGSALARAVLDELAHSPSPPLRSRPGRTAFLMKLPAASPDPLHVKVYRESILSSRARTSFRMGRALLETGFPTPEPLLLLSRRTGLFRESVLVCRGLDSPVLFTDELKARILRGSSCRQLLDDVANLTARFHRTGFFHADLTASNILLVDGNVILIDLDRTKDLRALPSGVVGRIQVLDLRMLLLTSWGEVSRPSWLRLLARYGHTRGLDRNKCRRLARSVLSARRGRIRLGATAPPLGGRTPWA